MRVRGPCRAKESSSITKAVWRYVEDTHYERALTNRQCLVFDLPAFNHAPDDKRFSPEDVGQQKRKGMSFSTHPSVLWLFLLIRLAPDYHQ